MFNIRRSIERIVGGLSLADYIIALILLGALSVWPDNNPLDRLSSGAGVATTLLAAAGGGIIIGSGLTGIKRRPLRKFDNMLYFALDRARRNAVLGALYEPLGLLDPQLPTKLS